MCVRVCMYICIHICRETLSKSKRFNQQPWTFFLWSTKKNIPRFEVKWNWICCICPIAMGRCSYMFLMDPSHGRLVTSLYNWIFKATGLIWAYFQSVLRVMGVSPTTMVIFRWISGGGWSSKRDLSNKNMGNGGTSLKGMWTGLFLYNIYI